MTNNLKGTMYHKTHKKWYSTITVRGKRIYLGCLDNELAAHSAYKEASLRLHGEFSVWKRNGLDKQSV